jgi:hypothetical protein
MDFEKHLRLPGLQQRCRLHDVKITQADVTIRGSTNYAPEAAVYEISLAWPNLTFELGYDYDNDMDFQKWQVKAGEETLLEYFQGYFIPAKPGDSVHHRWVFPRVPDNRDVEKEVRSELRAQGVFLTVPKPDEPAFTGAEVTRWTDDQIAAAIEKNFHQPFAFGIPSVLFTLNEPAYVSSLQHLSGKTPEEMHDLYQIAERDIRLTADELLWLDERRHFESVFHDNFMKEEYEHRFSPFLSDERLEQLCHGAGPRAQELQHERQVKKEMAALAEIWADGLLPYQQAEPLLKAKGLDIESWQYSERVREEAERRGVPPPADEDQALDADFLAELDALANELAAAAARTTKSSAAMPPASAVW